MSIKGHKDEDVISVFDPEVDAYRERPIVYVEKQLKAFGLTDAEVKEKIKKMKGEK